MRCGHVARLDELTDFGTAHLAIEPGKADEIEPDNGEPFLPADRLEQLHIAPTVFTEMKILTDNNGCCSKAFNNDLVHKRFGRFGGPLGCERNHHHNVDAGRFEQFEFLFERSEQLGGRLWPDHAGGMAVEGDDRRLQTCGISQTTNFADDGLVPKVHPVVGADGHHRAPPIGMGDASRGAPRGRIDYLHPYNLLGVDNSP